MKLASLSHVFVASALYFAHTFAATITEPSQLPTSVYDYIIVGAGTAGLALANRLTESPDTSVLVLEAGVSDDNVVPVMAPFLGPSVTPNTPWDWNYTVTPQSGLDGRTFPYPRGRLLGGSSSANYMIHQYGTNENWDRIAKVTKDEGWSWNNMKQYIDRHENFIVDPLDGHNTTNQFIPSLHSFSGILDISLYVATQDIDGRVISTTQQLDEFPYNEDISGINNNLLGIGWAQSSMNKGARASSSTSYLANANSRPNLTVLINAMVTKLLPTGESGGLKSFRNVQFVDARTFAVTPTFEVKAKKEVILSAGSVGTPQILQLSGIGASADLKPLGIPVQIDNPHVGKNLQDHPLLPNIFTVTENRSLDHILRDPVAVQAGIAEWTESRSGFVSNNVINNLGFARVAPKVLKEISDPSAGPTTPHYEIIFANFWLDPVVPVPATGSFLTILTAVLTPTSRGSVKIRSTNPFDAPFINPNMLATTSDIRVMRESIKAIKRFAAAPAWDGYVTGAVGKLWSAADADLDAHARQHATTVFHPTSTASMTSHASSDGVLNPDLTVKGTEGLRVVDLSAIPFIPSCHPQGSAYLIAERAADLIKAKVHDINYADPLAPQVVIT